MLPLLFLALASSSLPVHASRPPNAILLSHVRTLTLRGNGAKTSHRRVPAVPQLQCLSGPLCDLYPIDRMRCTNQGSSYGPEDVEWTCSASLPEDLKLGSIDVICEGYDSTDDPYVLKGSCAVEYRLILTEKGEKRHPHLARTRNSSIDWSAWLFAPVFIARGDLLVPVPVVTVAVAVVEEGRGRGRGGGGGWNLGWGSPPDDPPPPYPGTKPSSTHQQGGRQQGWSPGFWSGLVGGAAAGYMAGGRRRDDSARRGSYPANTGAGPSSSSWSSYSSGPSSSEAGPSRLHESTGFGSTRRR
ncbi:DUF1183 domain protein [Ophiocordyceps camponoti-floridani]|uniref:Store-operated calcium entry-associated regulatory factor n=1 Tax=Ophiocordyceps camponoti-floridani TaxID=2030778 RepID=A0A8H4Q1G0_9HYPO|nr:DUF1183 domain protein [Ophiocordyceps camponoti-floridani]